MNKKENVIANLTIHKKLYKMAKPNVEELVKWLRKTATDIQKNSGKYTNATFRYIER